VLNISILGLKLSLGAKPTKVPRDDETKIWAPVLLGGKLADIYLIRIIAYCG